MGFGRTIGFAPGLGPGEGLIPEYPELPVTRAVRASSDDCHRHNTAFYLTATELQAGHLPAHNYACAWRFLDIPLFKDQAITTARIYFKAADSQDSIPVNLRGEANASPATFSTYADWAARTRTTAGGRTYTGNVVADTWYSLDVKDIIEEIIALAAWQKGNPIVIFFDTDTLAARRHEYYSFDADPDDAAYLEIT